MNNYNIDYIKSVLENLLTTIKKYGTEKYKFYEEIYNLIKSFFEINYIDEADDLGPYDLKCSFNSGDNLDKNKKNELVNENSLNEIKNENKNLKDKI